MMHFTKPVGYAIHALSRLGMAGEDYCMIRDVAKHIGIGNASVAKLLAQLTSHGLVYPKRGYRGGISLARSPETITLLEVVEAVDERKWIGECPFGLQHCPAAFHCPAHEPWKAMCEEMQKLLAKTTVADIIRATPPHDRQQPPANPPAPLPRGSTFFVFPEEASAIREVC
jgi:Rrf2 family protein